MGKLAVPEEEIFALPTGLGVSLSEVSAFTKLGSSATAVWRPVSSSICAAGLGCVELVLLLDPWSLLPQAAAPVERAATARTTAGVRRFIGVPFFGVGTPRLRAGLRRGCV